jgi:hypothetical protein
MVATAKVKATFFFLPGALHIAAVARSDPPR